MNKEPTKVDAHATADPEALVPAPLSGANHWIIVRPNGEHFLLEKEPLEGIQEWARGQDVVIWEYAFVRIVYPAQGKKK